MLNRFGNTVTGDTLEFDEVLPNIDTVVFLNDTWEVFGSYSQSFSIAELGRVIRDSGTFGAGDTFSAKTFETVAETVDNYELGFRHFGDVFAFSAVAFYSESDNGTTFDQDLVLQKFSETISGIELAANYIFSDTVSFGGSASWAEGERDSQDNEKVDLDNTRISPMKLTAYTEFRPRPGWQNRLQVMYVGDREPDTGADAGFASGDVSTYTIVDFSSSFDLGPGRFNVAVANLLNRDYYPAVNQAFNANFGFSKGPGRTLSLGYSVDY